MVSKSFAFYSNILEYSLLFECVAHSQQKVILPHLGLTHSKCPAQVPALLRCFPLATTGITLPSSVLPQEAAKLP